MDFIKSSFCESSGCIEVGFHKSTFSGDQNGCVQVDCWCHEDKILVRDSKNPHGPTLVFTNTEWDAFLKGAKAGEFDLG